jgi:outer membrane protein OmpA-like peptidoglycan-associated protein
MATVTAVILLCAGCTAQNNPFMQDGSVTKTTSGAAIGAAAGGAIGAVASSHNRGEHALIGAGVGALAGGAVGYYMDSQASTLREQLAGTGVDVTRNGDQIALNMPGEITFATGSAELTPAVLPVLDSVAKVLLENDKTVINVTGYTDDTGSADSNQLLSERRARSVTSYLETSGIAPARLVAVGRGEASPMASNATADGRRQNRRVQLTVVPRTASVAPSPQA